MGVNRIGMERPILQLRMLHLLPATESTAVLAVKRGQCTALVAGAVGQFAVQGFVGFVEELVEASHRPPCGPARADRAQRRTSTLP